MANASHTMQVLHSLHDLSKYILSILLSICPKLSYLIKYFFAVYKLQNLVNFFLLIIYEYLNRLKDVGVVKFLHDLEFFLGSVSLLFVVFSLHLNCIRVCSVLVIYLEAFEDLSMHAL